MLIFPPTCTLFLSLCSYCLHEKTTQFGLVLCREVKSGLYRDPFDTDPIEAALREMPLG